MRDIRLRPVILVALIVAFYTLPGTTAFAGPPDHPGGLGNARGVGNVEGENSVVEGAMLHGPGQDSPADHDNGFGNDPPSLEAPTSPDPAVPADPTVIPDPSPGPAPTPDLAVPADPTLIPEPSPGPAPTPDLAVPVDPTIIPDPTPTTEYPSPPPPAAPPGPQAEGEPQAPPDPTSHGPGQDSPADHDNGFGNDPPPLEAPTSPDPAVPADPTVIPDPTPTTEDPSSPHLSPDSPTSSGEPVEQSPGAATVPAGPEETSHPSETPNSPPVASPGDTVAFSGGVAAIDLTSFVTDADGDSLTVVSQGSSGHGSVVVFDSVAVFTPEPGFFGITELRFTACDPSGACIDTTVSVFVPPVNDILIATNDPAMLSRFVAGAGSPADAGDLVTELLLDSVEGLAVPMAGAAGVIGGSLLFGLHRISTSLEDLLRELLRRL